MPFCISLLDTMKLPFILPGSGGGSGYHGFSEGLHDDDLDTESTDDFGSENAEQNFDEYMWMEHEEEFDKIEMQRLEEEELIKQCMENAQDDDDDVADSEHYHVWVAQYE